MTDELDFLEDDKPEEAEAPEVVEKELEPEVEAQAEEPEQETGEENEPEVTPTPDEDEKPVRQVDLKALLDEREKRQEAQRASEEAARKAAELERKLAELQKPKEEAPDWWADPAAAAQHQAQTIEQRFEAQRLSQSKFFAEREFGAETVNEALEYFDKNPQFSAQFMDQPSPFHAAVEFYKRQKLVDEIGTDPDAYLNSRVEALLEERLRQAAGAPSKPKTPPPSMARAASAGTDTQSSGSTFDDMFG